MEEERREDMRDMWTSALREQEEAMKEVQSPQERREEELGMEVSDKLKRYLDIPLKVEVVVGSTVLTLGELLHLTPGSVVELEQKVETPVDIKVNGKLVAKGEIVIVEDKFGVRIIDIVNREERLKRVV
ncbi:MAG: flagellar motor switch protein FliN [Aquificaceae bacterium]|nr:flagellar motor switch protein FliN [Aquificaceae bacterium]MCS7196051.1 flagellar motor switch protein FliN [Aquificaceae bacterium]MCX7990243.1 flagellar motor switch protein FliN [Aquificaceae bacterium]MDW8032281.1 flagellar motor switch protein FliN [Aquificaceae bacterium]MDW8294447.1 flagellar motor switch protein FliN [Aquificaceae bacterium]